RRRDRPADADRKYSAGQLLMEHGAGSSSCLAGCVYTSRPGSPYRLHDLCPHTAMWVPGGHPTEIAVFQSRTAFAGSLISCGAEQTIVEWVPLGEPISRFSNRWIRIQGSVGNQ